MNSEDQSPDWFFEMQARQAEALKIGTRVRVDLGECRGIGRFHGTQEQGAMGTVIGTDSTEQDGHPYTVMFDRSLSALGYLSVYSASELIPMSTEEWIAAMLAPLTVD